jgi:hypothetical protein
MASPYYLWSGAGGSATGADWTNAFTTLTAAIAAATTNGDVIKVHKSHTEELGADTTYTPTANINIICVDKDASDALATMGTAAWIGNSSTARAITLASAKTIYMRGVTFRISPGSARLLTVASADGGSYDLVSCYLWLGSDATGSRIQFGGATNGSNTFVRLINSTLRIGNVVQSILLGAHCELIGCSLSSSGSVPTYLFSTPTNDIGGASMKCIDCDWSYATGTLVADMAYFSATIEMYGCKLGSGVTPLASQTNTSNASGELFLFDCSSGDNHYEFGHYSALGNTVAVTSPYVSDGALYDGTNHVTWSITTSAYATFYAPYRSPWINKYHSGTSAITPNIEGLKINDATVAQDDEIWAEFTYKGTSGYVLGTLVNDRMTVLGTAADQTSSKTYSDWTASPATDSGDSVFKLQSASITPAELGMLCARVCVGAASVTVYIDPQIRT